VGQSDEIYFDIAFLLIVAIAFAIRFYPSARMGAKSIDNYYHLLAARQIRNEKGLPRRLNGFLVEGTYSYPPVIHLVLALLVSEAPEKTRKIPFLIAPAFDTLSVVLIYFFVAMLVGKAEAVIAAVMYAVTPLLVIESIPISPRPLGALFLNLYMLLMFMYASTHNLWLFVPASVVCVPLVLLSHKMATQSMFFATIASSIVFFFIDPMISAFGITALPAGVGFTFLVSGGFYKKVLRGHRAMLSYHFRHGDYRDEKKFGNPLQIIQRWPWLAILALAAYLVGLSPPLTAELLVPLIWGIILIALTLLWRYGDNYRYLVYAVAPLSIVFAATMAALSQLWFIVLFTLAIVFSGLRLGHYFRRRTKDSPISDDLLECLKYIKSDKAHSSMGCVPVTLNYPCAYYSEKAVLGAEASPEPWEKGEDLSSFYKDENLLTELMSKYGTQLFLVDAADPAGISFESILRSSKLIESTLVRSCSRFMVYELKAKSV